MPLTASPFPLHRMGVPDVDVRPEDQLAAIRHRRNLGRGRQDASVLPAHHCSQRGAGAHSRPDAGDRWSRGLGGVVLARGIERRELPPNHSALHSGRDGSHSGVTSDEQRPGR